METIKKIGQFIVLPIIVIFAIFKIFFKSNIQDSIDSLNNAQNTDDQLNNAQNTHNNAANDSLAKADEIAKEKEEIKNSDGDLDWHKKV